MIESLHDVNAHSPSGRILRFFLNLIPKTHVAKVRGGINKGSRWVVGTSIHRCWLGSYELEKQQLLERLLKPGMVVWDVGANAGFYTLAMSKLVGAEGHVFSFEPLGDNIQKLNRHIRLNQLGNISVVQVALSDSVGLCGFDLGISHQKGFLSKNTSGYLVPCMTAYEFVKSKPEAVPSLLKIDIEGAESGMLEGAREMISKHRPILLLALHGPDQVLKCNALLQDLGYTVDQRVPDPDACGEEILAIPPQIV
ncbi:MAG: methyltransferase FkbM family protein [Verrucomicrobiales bacterium]|nr:methyltransferase FkbM family protein [Verrucomicrobiales bacterium]